MELPHLFIERLNTQFGSQEAKQFIDALSNEPKSAIRINPKKWKNSLDTAYQVPWCDSGFFLAQRPNYTLEPLFHAGCYYPQDASSMFLNEALTQIYGEERDLTILDLCAAPGGKSTLIASWLDGKGFLVANEVIKHRAQILRENLLKWGYPNVAVTNNDPAHYAKLGGTFDCIVIDAPCSGEGLFRKDNEAVNEWSSDNLALCASRQKRILMDALEALNEDGIIIYSTCTFNPEENEKNIEWLATQSDIEVINLEIDSTWGVTEVAMQNGKGYGFYPHKVEGEGFFLAAFRKKGEERAKSSSRTFKKAKSKENIILPKNIIKDLTSYTLKHINELIFAFPESYTSLIETLQKNLYLIHLGICIGEDSPKGVLPNHALALSTQLGTHYPTIELDKTQALLYLRGESSFQLQGENGWNIVTYEQTALGFVKVMQNRFNNYYPKEYRIRMSIT